MQSWKAKYGLDPVDETINRDEDSFIWWNMTQLHEMLTYEQQHRLTEKMNLVKDQVESKLEMKFIQVNLVLELFEELFSEYQHLPQDKKTKQQIRKNALMKALKKSFMNEFPVGAERERFKDSSQVLNYSWRLFQDKINQNINLLADKNNPRIKFNKDKYYEFRFGT